MCFHTSMFHFIQSTSASPASLDPASLDEMVGTCPRCFWSLSWVIFEACPGSCWSLSSNVVYIFIFILLHAILQISYNSSIAHVHLQYHAQFNTNTPPWLSNSVFEKIYVVIDNELDMSACFASDEVLLYCSVKEAMSFAVVRSATPSMASKHH